MCAHRLEKETQLLFGQSNNLEIWKETLMSEQIFRSQYQSFVVPFIELIQKSEL